MSIRKKMKLEKALQAYQDDSDKVSELTRQLAFAGIAVIWIFNKSGITGYSLPKSLIVPVAFFIVSLILEFLQYFYGAIIYYFLYHHGERTEDLEDGKTIKKVYKWKGINLPKNIFYYCKITALFLGYVYLLGYLNYIFFKS